MSFLDEINAAADDFDQRARDIHKTYVELTKQSWQSGDPRTGSPGVIVDKATLKNSIMVEEVSPTESIIATNEEYAPAIEDGIGPHGPLTQRQPVGGFHALALTIAGFPALVEAAVQAHS